MTGRTGHVWPPPEGGQTSRSDTTRMRLQLRSRYPNPLINRVNQVPSYRSIPRTGGTIVLPPRDVALLIAYPTSAAATPGHSLAPSDCMGSLGYRASIHANARDDAAYLSKVLQACYDDFDQPDS